MIKKKWSSMTLGCRANQADTIVIEQILFSAGWEKVGWGEPCDITLINTCTVTARSDRQCRKTINRAARANPGGAVVVMGCFARLRGTYKGCSENVLMFTDKEPGDLARRLLKVSGCLGDDSNTCSSVQKPGPGVSSFLTLIGEKPPDAEKYKKVIPGSFPSRPPLKVQDGCANRCAFCTVCLARGVPRSMPAERVLRELETLGEAGVGEVVLTGINLGAWGEDLGTQAGIIELLSVVLPSLPTASLKRIRLSSLEPQHVSRELIGLIKEYPERICPHLHLPLQSGDDEILSLMKRPYTFSEYSDVVIQAVQEIPGICIGADVLCGFPQETEDRFRNSYTRIESLPLAYLHVFPFSSRPETAAASMSGKISDAEIKSRAKELRELSDKKRRSFRKSQLGHVRLAIVEHRVQQTTLNLMATTDNYLEVPLKGAEDLVGKITEVKITPVKTTPVKTTPVKTTPVKTTPEG